MNQRLTTVRQPAARGMIFIHTTSAALCPHIEWALGSVLNAKTSLEWTEQPAEKGKKRAELSWVGAQGTGTALASALAEFGQLRFEVVEEPSPGSDGQRFCFTPTLGPYTATIGVHGDVLLREDAVKRAIADEALGGDTIYKAMERMLGVPWDEELEVFRYAGEEAPVRWLHQVI
ncbi:DUF3145 domain-containing protein [Tessaracoccus caeni]|uniref:DUF3145 domain-containing protein n=1 Tax=Tessaracoccus caeni TaxID=3031239 RepID=UPI0023DBD2ED|nr:DUF3145 domain-containing protein [Tessaracoccus caeni]MDF1490318.1 DUF3145 domain-containing protein [Tessaracoccus caeni]